MSNKDLQEDISAWLADADDPSLLISDGITPEEVMPHLVNAAEKIMLKVQEELVTND